MDHGLEMNHTVYKLEVCARSVIRLYYYNYITIVVCEDPVNVAGAYKEYSCTSPGCLVVYSCKEAEGYQRVDGMGYRKCGENGKWINTLPTCTSM